MTPRTQLNSDKPTAAPDVWPMPGHRTVAEVDAERRQTYLDGLNRLVAYGFGQVYEPAHGTARKGAGV